MESAKIAFWRNSLFLLLALCLNLFSSNVFAEESWNNNINNAETRINNFQKILKDGTPQQIQKAAVELNSDPLAKDILNRVDNPAANKLKESFNKAMKPVKQATRAGVKQRVADKLGVKPEDVTIFEATNPKNPGDPSKLPQDWDVTVRVKGKDIKTENVESIVHEEFYKAAGGKETFGENSSPAKVGKQQGVEVTHSKHPEAFGSNAKEGEAILKGDKTKPIRDPQGLSETLKYKGNKPRTEGTLEGEFKGNYETVKGFDKQVKPRVEGQGGRIPDKVQEGIDIMRDGLKKGKSPDQIKSELAEIGETPESITRKSSDLIEAGQKLKPPPKPPATSKIIDPKTGEPFSSSGKSTKGGKSGLVDAQGNPISSKGSSSSKPGKGKVIDPSTGKPFNSKSQAAKSGKSGLVDAQGNPISSRSDTAVQTGKGKVIDPATGKPFKSGKTGPIKINLKTKPGIVDAQGNPISAKTGKVPTTPSTVLDPVTGKPFNAPLKSGKSGLVDAKGNPLSSKPSTSLTGGKGKLIDPVTGKAFTSKGTPVKAGKSGLLDAKGNPISGKGASPAKAGKNVIIDPKTGQAFKPGLKPNTVPMDPGTSQSGNGGTSGGSVSTGPGGGAPPRFQEPILKGVKKIQNGMKYLGPALILYDGGSRIKNVATADPEKQSYEAGKELGGFTGGMGGATAGGLAGAKLGTMLGGALGSVVPVVGNIAGAAAGGIIGGFIGGIAGYVKGSEVGSEMGDTDSQYWDKNKPASYFNKKSGAAGTTQKLYTKMITKGVPVAEARSIAQKWQDYLDDKGPSPKKEIDEARNKYINPKKPKIQKQKKPEKNKEPKGYNPFADQGMGIDPDEQKIAGASELIDDYSQKSATGQISDETSGVIGGGENPEQQSTDYTGSSIGGKPVNTQPDKRKKPGRPGSGNNNPGSQTDTDTDDDKSGEKADKTGLEVEEVGTAPPGKCKIVSGQLVAVKGYTEKIAGMTVILSGPTSQTTTSSGSGSFSFAEIPAGDYTISVKEWDYGMTSANLKAPPGKAIKLVLKGSCPYLYVWTGKSYVAENDIYSTARINPGEVLAALPPFATSTADLSVMRFPMDSIPMELGKKRSYLDYYQITHQPARTEGGLFQFKIIEQDWEYSFTDMVSLKAIARKEGHGAGVTRDGKIFYFHELKELASFKNLLSHFGKKLEDPLGKKGLGLHDQQGFELDLPRKTFDNGVLEITWTGFLNGQEKGKSSTPGKPRLMVQRQNSAGHWQTVDHIYPRDEKTKSYVILDPKGDDWDADQKIRLVATNCLPQKFHQIFSVKCGSLSEWDPEILTFPLELARKTEIKNLQKNLIQADGTYVRLKPSEEILLQFNGEKARTDIAYDFFFISEGFYIPAPHISFAAMEQEDL